MQNETTVFNLFIFIVYSLEHFCVYIFSKYFVFIKFFFGQPWGGGWILFGAPSCAIIVYISILIF